MTKNDPNVGWAYSPTISVKQTVGEYAHPTKITRTLFTHPFFFALLLLAAGCGSSIHDTALKGPVDPDLYKEAVETNQQRIAGEDHPIKHSIFMTPFDAMSSLFDTLIGDPLAHLWDYMSHDTPAVAVRKMLDQYSPDNRRSGTLRLVERDFARKGPELKIYAHLAEDPDYTVRAAGIRALNRSRAKEYTDLFIRSLKDDQLLVRMEAAKALANIPDKAAIGPLIDRLKNDEGQDVQIACADALRNYKTTEVASALVTMLDDKDFAVAWQARQSLEMITAQDFRYDARAWLNYLAQGKHFG